MLIKDVVYNMTCSVHLSIRIRRHSFQRCWCPASPASLLFRVLTQDVTVSPFCWCHHQLWSLSCWIIQTDRCHPRWLQCPLRRYPCCLQHCIWFSKRWPVGHTLRSRTCWRTTSKQGCLSGAPLFRLHANGCCSCWALISVGSEGATVSKALWSSCWHRHRSGPKPVGLCRPRLARAVAIHWHLCWSPCWHQQARWRSTGCCASTRGDRGLSTRDLLSQMSLWSPRTVGCWAHSCWIEVFDSMEAASAVPHILCWRRWLHHLPIEVGSIDDLVESSGGSTVLSQLLSNDLLSDDRQGSLPPAAETCWRSSCRRLAFLLPH